MHGGKGPVTGRPQGSPLLCDGLASWCVHGGKGTFFPSPGHFTLCVIRQQSLSAGGFLGQVVTVVGTLASPMGAGGKRQGNRTPGDPSVPTLLPCHPRSYYGRTDPGSLCCISVKDTVKSSMEEQGTQSVSLSTFLEVTAV